MVDRASLEGRLQELAAAGLGAQGGRRLRAGSPDGLLRVLLRELDTVVMPRVLRIEVAGKTLPIEAASRRVLSYGPDAEVDLRGVGPGDVAASDAFKARILDLLGASDSVTLAYLPLEREFDPTETGLSVSTLAESWGVGMVGIGEAGVFLDRLMSLAGDGEVVLGWVIQDGEVVETVGDEDIITGLQDLGASDRFAELIDAAGANSDPWRFAAVTDDATGAAATVVATFGETRILMAAAPGQLGKLSDIWRQALNT